MRIDESPGAICAAGVLLFLALVYLGREKIPDPTSLRSMTVTAVGLLQGTLLWSRTSKPARGRKTSADIVTVIVAGPIIPVLSLVARHVLMIVSPRRMVQRMTADSNGARN